MEKNQIYKCEECGNVVELVGAGGGQLTCCNQPMKLLEEQTADPATQKHVPVVEEIKGGIKVKVGTVPHPMTEEHSIKWIEVINRDYVNRKYLKPGDAPEAEFYVPMQDGLVIREYCNQHGLWINKF